MAIKAGRNDICPCGSKKKYKKCHGATERSSRKAMLFAGLLIAVLAGGLYAAVVGFNDQGTSSPVRGKVWSPEHGHYH